MFGRWTLAAELCGLTLLTVPAGVDACGGCFAPSETESVVTDHRMVMAIHPTESILWDQIRYAGSPQNFAWILPVQGDVTVDVASGDFFDQLDAATAPRVSPPPSTCPSTGALFSSNSASAPGGAEDTGVTVLHTAVVGPYQTVTLRAASTDALTTWLQNNGYAIPTAVEPVIAYYNNLHMDFVALRLAPGQGINAMQPIRIRFASATTVLPLRMVAAGASDKIGVTLFVFSAGRYEALNFANGVVDPTQLVWNFGTNTSNYESVFEATGQRLGSAAWITQAAGPAVTYEGNQTATGSTDDWGLAMADLPVAWVTRMRADLPLPALNQDLQLAAAMNDSPVSNVLQAGQSVQRPPCATNDGLYSGTDTSATGLSCIAGPRSSNGDLPTILAGLAAATAVFAPRRRR